MMLLSSGYIYCDGSCSCTVDSQTTMEHTKRVLTAVVLVVLSVTLVFGTSQNDATDNNDITTVSPSPASFLDTLLNSLTGYRISGISSKTCKQIGGMYITANCIIIAPSPDMKTGTFINKYIGG
ncbi:uncharacterized protein LOC132562772 isoform X2 [Ylistrum balloti]|uniref:uncharacterized protein LOC132562772 isoform X2 n=1 Tax=Ylistrum balloti TaxID=509963 RepID=UPI002905EB13|nr:uncharacterized protein LOC132562772 isoform X2 [Ylistrum balloti]